MWTLSTSLVGAAGSNEFSLQNEGTAHIVGSANSSNVEVVRVLNPDTQRELGRMVVGPFGVKLEAITDKLIITPGQSHAASPSSAKFELQPRNDSHSEAIFLRHGDVLHFPSSKSNLMCQWTDSEIQVNSSAAPYRGVVQTPEDETEDESLDKSPAAVVTQNRNSGPRATPQLSHQQSLVIQETPTAARVNSASNCPPADINPSDFAYDTRGPVKDTSLPSREPEAELEPVPETFSTARTGESQGKGPAPQSANGPSPADAPATRLVASKDGLSLGTTSKTSPQVQIPPRSARKRSTSAVKEGSESEHDALASAPKRAKTGKNEEARDARLSSVDTASQKSSRKGKKRRTEALDEAEEHALTRSPLSTQQSTHASTEAYDGPTPKVASSNSTITKSSQAVKFLKKQGGVYVEKLTDDFNILCVRDGELQKKTKVLYAIARGIPIVTDMWLLDSAKEGRILPLSGYKPSTSKQEAEWKFTFDNVFGQPQTPFEGYNIHFTKSLKAVYESFSEVAAVCKAAGANNVTSTRMNTTGDNIVLANNYDDDLEAQKLMKDGVTCYTKDLFTYSIFRGSVDLESDEFKIKAPDDSTPSKEKKKRGRKST
ncbi:hypothetical protein yc1106_05434 [Curvularia clavata]|uniref:BRCT domain-containing protein n=1 Tax=Curvularia clavata TaxID=95742 RepID=A0A9Q9DTM1_CURCL|nr:hypothetical protein yc1106_05434 [Curvularia clavata]